VIISGFISGFILTVLLFSNLATIEGMFTTKGDLLLGKATITFK
jgi:hypothetical protein